MTGMCSQIIAVVFYLLVFVKYQIDCVNRGTLDSMMHLTNYAINKESENFVVDDSEGHKRRFAAINEWLR